MAQRGPEVVRVTVRVVALDLVTDISVVSRYFPSVRGGLDPSESDTVLAALTDRS